MDTPRLLQEQLRQAHALGATYAHILFGEEHASPEAMAEWGAHEGYLAERQAKVTGAALQPTVTATTVSIREGETLIIDGPFADTKEYLGGIYILECANLDEAMSLPGAIRGRQPATSKSVLSLTTADPTNPASVRNSALAVVDAISREESARILATLIRASDGDFQLAEDALQGALLAAVRHWPAAGRRVIHRHGSMPRPAQGH